MTIPVTNKSQGLWVETVWTGGNHGWMIPARPVFTQRAKCSCRAGDQQADRPERRQPDAGTAGLFCRLAAPLCFPNFISWTQTNRLVTFAVTEECVRVPVEAAKLGRRKKERDFFSSFLHVFLLFLILYRSNGRTVVIQLFFQAKQGSECHKRIACTFIQ